MSAQNEPRLVGEDRSASHEVPDKVAVDASLTGPPTGFDDYDVVLRNCNNISEARVTIRRGALNIKYGPNGLGKSTIAKALALNADGQQNLDQLLPFKYREGGGAAKPTVEGADGIKSVLIFDENYVSQFVFQPDEVVKNSFEIFIDTPQYRAGIAEIEEIFEDVKSVFSENQAVDDMIAALTDLKDAFNLTKSGAIAKTSRGLKALRVGGKLDVIPDSLGGFEEFLQGGDPAGWVSWQAKGRAYVDTAQNCPFCSRPIVDRSAILQVSEEYESNSVRALGNLRSVIDRLASLFVPERLEQLRGITRKIDSLTPEEEHFLTNLRGQVETLLLKFLALKGLSFMSLRDEPDMEGALRNLKIDLTLLDALNSDYAENVFGEVNGEIDRLSDRVNEVKKKIGTQRSQVARSISRNQDDINAYLRSAGYDYVVRIESGRDDYRMVLEHRDALGHHVESASNHLSFGERNAFAMVLFMHQVRRDRPDLVVLDDPVSSFDKTKKFAILHRLFHGSKSLRDFTTLMLTHDIEPAIDIFQSDTAGLFAAVNPSVHFLSSRDGMVREQEIRRSDFMTFGQVCDENILYSSDLVIQSIYLRRRYYLDGERGDAYEVLSSLLHLRETPSRKDGRGVFTPLSQEESDAACDVIRQRIPGFDYAALLAELKDLDCLRKKFNETYVGYEKVQIFRIAAKLEPGLLSGDAPLRKFVNESYHIENEYVMQLNPRKFDSVPSHIVRACSEAWGSDS